MKSLRLWIAFALFCVIAVPVTVFLGGLWLAGPYAGDNGFMGMLRNIYRDALSGNLGAIGMLMSPVAIVAIWRLAFLARAMIPAETPHDVAAADTTPQG